METLSAHAGRLAARCAWLLLLAPLLAAPVGEARAQETEDPVTILSLPPTKLPALPAGANGQWPLSEIFGRLKFRDRTDRWTVHTSYSSALPLPVTYNTDLQGQKTVEAPADGVDFKIFVQHPATPGRVTLSVTVQAQEFNDTFVQLEPPAVTVFKIDYEEPVRISLRAQTMSVWTGAPLTQTLDFTNAFFINEDVVRRDQVVGAELSLAAVAGDAEAVSIVRPWTPGEDGAVVREDGSTVGAEDVTAGAGDPAVTYARGAAPAELRVRPQGPGSATVDLVARFLLREDPEASYDLYFVDDGETYHTAPVTTRIVYQFVEGEPVTRIALPGRWLPALSRTEESDSLQLSRLFAQLVLRETEVGKFSHYAIDVGWDAGAVSVGEYAVPGVLAGEPMPIGRDAVTVAAPFTVMHPTVPSEVTLNLTVRLFSGPGEAVVPRVPDFKVLFQPVAEIYMPTQDEPAYFGETLTQPLRVEDIFRFNDVAINPNQLVAVELGVVTVAGGAGAASVELDGEIMTEGDVAVFDWREMTPTLRISPTLAGLSKVDLRWRFVMRGEGRHDLLSFPATPEYYSAPITTRLGYRVLGPRWAVPATLQVTATESGVLSEPLPPITVATDVGALVSVSGELRPRLENARVMNGFPSADLWAFGTMPSLTINEERELLLTGIRRNRYRSGEWTATVLLENDGEPRETMQVGVATISLTPVNTPPFRTIYRTLSLTIPDNGGVMPAQTLLAISDLDSTRFEAEFLNDQVSGGNVSAPEDLWEVRPRLEFRNRATLVMRDGVPRVGRHGIWTATLNQIDPAGHPLPGEPTHSVQLSQPVTVSVSLTNKGPLATAAALSLQLMEDQPLPQDEPLLTVATGVRDREGDAITARLIGMRSADGPAGIWSTTPTLTLGGEELWLHNGVLREDRTTTWTATIVLEDSIDRPSGVTVGVLSVVVTPVRDGPKGEASNLLTEVSEDTHRGPQLIARVRHPDGLPFVSMLVGATVSGGNVDTPEALFYVPPFLYNTVAGRVFPGKIFLRDFTTKPNAYGLWTATAVLRDRGEPPLEYTLGVLSIDVAPVNDRPSLRAATLSQTLNGGSGMAPELTVATIIDVDSSVFGARLENIQVFGGNAGSPDELWQTAPTLTFADSELLLRGGVLSPGRHATWTAMVVVTDEPGVEPDYTVTLAEAVTIEVVSANSAPLATAATLSAALLEDQPLAEGIAMRALTVATGVRDLDGDAITPLLQGARLEDGGASLWTTAPTLTLNGGELLLHSGALAADRATTWTATAVLQDDGDPPAQATVGVLSVVVRPVRDAPRSEATELSLQIDEDAGYFLQHTFARAWHPDGLDFTASLVGATVSAGNADIAEQFWTEQPYVTVAPATDNPAVSKLILKAGYTRPNVYGLWTATAVLRDNGAPPLEHTVGVVSVVAAPVNDPPAVIPVESQLTMYSGSTVMETLTVANVFDIESDMLETNVFAIDIQSGMFDARLDDAQVSGGNVGESHELWRVAPTLAIENDELLLRGGEPEPGNYGVWTAMAVVIDAVGEPAHTVAMAESVTIDVKDVNDPPEAATVTLSLRLFEDQPLPQDEPLLVVAAGVSDMEGDAIAPLLLDARLEDGGGPLWATTPTLMLNGGELWLHGGALAADRATTWTATVALADDGDPPARATLGVLTVQALPVNDTPTVVPATLSQTVRRSVMPPPLTVATFADIDSDAFSGRLENIRVSGGDVASPDELWRVAPTLTAEGGALALRGGVLFAGRHSTWTATAALIDGGGAPARAVTLAQAVTIAVQADPIFLSGTLLNTSLTLTEDQSLSRSSPLLVVASGVRYAEGRAVTARLVGERFVNQGFDALWATSPTLTLSGDELLLQGGQLAEDGAGLWNVTAVFYSDDAPSVRSTLGVLSVSVVPVRDAPRARVDRPSTRLGEDLGAVRYPIGTVWHPDRLDYIGLQLRNESLSGGNIDTLGRGTLWAQSHLPLLAYSRRSNLRHSLNMVTQGGRNLYGTWTGTMVLTDRGEPPLERTIQVLTIEVTPYNDRPTVAARTLSQTLNGSSGMMPPLRIGMVTDVESDDGEFTLPLVSVRVSDGNAATSGELWQTEPTLTVENENLFLQGGVLARGRHGTWMGRAMVIDDNGEPRHTITFSRFATIVVRPVDDLPFATLATLSATLTEDQPPPSGAPWLTVATGVRDKEGDPITPMLAGAGPADGGPPVWATPPALTLNGDELWLAGGSLAADRSGAWTATALLDDDDDPSKRLTLGVATITVLPVNDPPTATPATLAQTLNGSSGAQPPLTAATFTDIDSVVMAAQIQDFQVSGGNVDDPLALWDALPTLAAENGEVILRGGVLAFGKHGVWTAAMVLTDTGGEPEHNVTLAQSVTVDVRPVNDMPLSTPLTALHVSLTEDQPLAPDEQLLRVAVDVLDLEGDAITPTLIDARMADGGADLWATSPTLTVRGGELWLQGGVLAPNRATSWTATAALDDDGAPPMRATVGVVTVVVTPVNDRPTMISAAGPPALTIDGSSGVAPPFTIGTVVDVDSDEFTLQLFSIVMYGGNLGTTGGLWEIAPTLALEDGHLILRGGVLRIRSEGIWATKVRLIDNAGEPAHTVTLERFYEIRALPVNDPPLGTLATLSAVFQEDESFEGRNRSLLKVATGVFDFERDTITPTLIGERLEEGFGLWATTPTLTLSGTTLLLDGGVLAPDRATTWTATAVLDDDGDPPLRATLGVVTIRVMPTRDGPRGLPDQLSSTEPEGARGIFGVTRFLPVMSVSHPDGLDVSLLLVDETVSGGNVGTPEELWALRPTVMPAGAWFELYGGRVYPDAHGVWMATLVLRDNGAPPLENTVGVVTITFYPVNDAPRASSTALTFKIRARSPLVPDDGAMPALRLALVSDPDGDDITATLEDAAAEGGNLDGRPLWETPPTAVVRDGALWLEDGVLHEDRFGVWTARPALIDDSGEDNNRAVLERVTVNVLRFDFMPQATPAPASLRAVTVAEDAPVPPLTAAVGLSVADYGDMPTMLGQFRDARVSGGNAPSAHEFFVSTPTLVIEGDTLVMRGARLRPDVRGAWSAQVMLSVASITGPSAESNTLALERVTVEVVPDDLEVTYPTELQEVDATGLRSRVAAVGLECFDPRSGARRSCEFYACPRAAADGDVPLADCARAEVGPDGPWTALPAGHSKVWWAAVAPGREGDAEFHAWPQPYYVKPVLDLGDDRAVPFKPGTLRLSIAVLGAPTTSTTTISEPLLRRAGGVETRAGQLELHPPMRETVVKELAVSMTEGSPEMVFTLAGLERWYSRHSDFALTVRGSSRVAPGGRVRATPGLLFNDGRPVGFFRAKATHRMAVDVEQYAGVPLSLSALASLRGSESTVARQAALPAAAMQRWEGELQLLAAQPGDVIDLTVVVAGNDAPAVTVARSYPVRNNSFIRDGDMDGVAGDDGDNVLAAGDGQRLMAPAGHHLRLGNYAAEMVSSGALLEDRALPRSPVEGPPPGYKGGGVYDFVSSLPLGVTLARVVIELSEPTELDAPVYYKLRSDVGWAPFVIKDDDRIYSAPAPCPAADETMMTAGGSTPMWTTGISRGHACVLLHIADRGDGDGNDEDGALNQEVADPGALGVFGSDTGGDTGDGNTGGGNTGGNTGGGNTGGGSAGGSGGGGGGGTVALWTLAALVPLAMRARRRPRRRGGQVRARV